MDHGDEHAITPVRCICGEDLNYEWKPDARGFMDLVVYRRVLSDGVGQWQPAQRCPCCARMLNYQWLDRVLRRAEWKQIPA